MKNQSNTEIEVRKITRVGSKRNSWIVTIPPKFIKDLEMEDSFVTFQMIKKMIIITKVTSRITRKKLDIIESQNISEETTAHTINNEIKETQDEEYNRIENERIDKILDDSIKNQFEEDNTKEIKKKSEQIHEPTQESIEESTQEVDDNTEEIKNILNDDIISKLEQ